MNFIILASVAALMFVAYQGLSKLLPSGISVFLVTAYASLSGAIVMLLIHLFSSADKSLGLTSRNLILACSIGVLISIGNFVILKAFSLGASQSSFSVILYPLIIILSAIVGVFLWHEKINTWQILGIMLAIVGIVLIFYFKESSQVIK